MNRNGPSEWPNGKGSNGIWENWVVVTPPKVDFGEISSDKNDERVFECSVKIQNIRSHGIKLNFQGWISIVHFGVLLPATELC